MGSAGTCRRTPLRAPSPCPERAYAAPHGRTARDRPVRRHRRPGPAQAAAGAAAPLPDRPAARRAGSSARRSRSTTATRSSRSPARPSTSSATGALTDEQWDAFAAMLHYVPGSGGAGGAARRPSRRPRRSCGGESRRACTTSACRRRRRSAVVHMLDEAGLVERSRIIMEKPFGTDLESARGAQRRAARGLRRGADLPDRPLPRQGGGAEHPGVPVRQRAVRADLEPQPHRPRADRRARDARPRAAGPRSTRPPAPTATWSSPTCSRCWRSWRWSRRPRWSRGPISEEKNKVFRSMLPIEPHDVVRGQYVGYRDIEGVAPRLRDRDLHRPASATIDNWRWAGVPFYLRTGKRLAEGARIISIAFQEPPRVDVPAPGSGVGDARPRPPDLRPRRPVQDVAVVLRQAARARACSSTSCRMQFAMHDTGWAGACSRPTSG